MDVQKSLEQMDRTLSNMVPMALANKAVLTLLLAGSPVTVEAARRVCASWMDPASGATKPVVDLVGAQVGEMLKSAEDFSPSPLGRA